MKRARCIYTQVMIQMYLLGWDFRELSERSDIPYTSLLRKLRGATQLYLDEAKKIQGALNCGMSLDVLFEKREERAA